jgi:ketosteroid isomerase-like protein
MKKLVYVTLVLACTLTCACSTSSRDNLDSYVKTLRLTTDSLLSALSSLDAERLISYYDLQAQMISPESGMNVGKENIKRSYASGFALPGFKISGTIQDVQVAKSGDIGYTLVPWDGYFLTESGEKKVQKGINLLVG